MADFHHGGAVHVTGGHGRREVKGLKPSQGGLIWIMRVVTVVDVPGRNYPVSFRSYFLPNIGLDHHALTRRYS